MKIIDLNEAMDVIRGSGFLAKQISSTEKLEAIYLNVKPDQKIELHTQPFPVTFFIISGSGTIFTDETASEVTPGKIIDVPPEVRRGWENLGTEDLEVLVIKHLA